MDTDPLRRRPLYISFDEAIALAAASGQGSTLIKRDLANAFRHIPVAPQDHWLLGFFWEGRYWLDCFLPFGLRTSPYLFDLFAKGIQFVIEADDCIHASFSALHYLDDFLGIGRPGVNPTIYEDRFHAACDTLGIQINHSKSVTGTTAQFHGIEIGTLAMQARLPPTKLSKVQTLIRHFSPQRSTHLAELQSLLGYLPFCAKVVPIGRSFLRRLFDATRGNHRAPTHHTGTSRNHWHTGNKHSPPIQMTNDMRADPHWWRDVLPAWNGISLIIQERRQMFLWTDASGTLGQGGAFSAVKPYEASCINWNQAFSKPLSRHHRGKDINYKEMNAVLVALLLWGEHFTQSRLVVYTDNSVVFHGLRH